MFLVFFNTPPKHILFYTKKINMRTKTTRQYRVKSSISKYILSNYSSYSLHVERDNSIIYQYTKIYQNTNKYTNTNYTQTGGKENALTRQTFALYKIQNLHTILSSSSFSSPSLHATTKKKRKENKIKFNSMFIQYCIPFCVPHFVFLMRHDLYIHLFRSYLLYLVFDVLLSIAYGNLSTYIYYLLLCFNVILSLTLIVVTLLVYWLLQLILLLLLLSTFYRIIHTNTHTHTNQPTNLLIHLMSAVLPCL